MANRYTQVSGMSSQQRFTSAVSGELAFSKFPTNPINITAFNAGDIVPIYCKEVLPHDTIDLNLDFVIRQTTIQTPTMGQMFVDFYAFFVPNRVVNKSWKTVQGENPNGSWTVEPVSLAPLVDVSSGSGEVTVPVGSVADYYGYPTQAGIPKSLLARCHDLKFRGYIEIYNEYFRDQNYQPPIPYSRLNVFENFFRTSGSVATLGVVAVNAPDVKQDNSVGAGAISQAVYGNLQPGTGGSGASNTSVYFVASSSFNALGKPLKANKIHDYFTSVLPSPQKGQKVFVPAIGPVSGFLPVRPIGTDTVTSSIYGLRWRASNGGSIPIGSVQLAAGSADTESKTTYAGSSATITGNALYPSNLGLDFGSGDISLSIDDIRMSAAIQQVYEQLSRGGSRYREFVRSFFGLDVEDPFSDIPKCLGHFRRNLDLYQTAQTSSSESGNTPQGNLAAFGYTSNGGSLIHETFLEHGYIHVLAVVRHKNLYSSFFARDNFRVDMLDFYLPQLANISEQPVYTSQINPFRPFSEEQGQQPFGYTEPFAEYRFDPDYVTGQMRSGIFGSLDIWNYSDPFNSDLVIATGDWLKSNSEEVLNRTLAQTSENIPQFKGQFNFHFVNERPMPVYSLPGLDIF